MHMHPCFPHPFVCADSFDSEGHILCYCQEIMKTLCLIIHKRSHSNDLPSHVFEWFQLKAEDLFKLDSFFRLTQHKPENIDPVLCVISIYWSCVGVTPDKDVVAFSCSQNQSACATTSPSQYLHIS